MRKITVTPLLKKANGNYIFQVDYYGMREIVREMSLASYQEYLRKLRAIYCVSNRELVFDFTKCEEEAVIDEGGNSMSNFISLNELLRPNGIVFPQVGNNILFSQDALKHEEITFNVNGLPQITKSEITIQGPEEKTVKEESIHELLEKQIKATLKKGDTGELQLIPSLIESWVVTSPNNLQSPLDIGVIEKMLARRLSERGD